MPLLILPVLVGLGFGAFLGAQVDDKLDDVPSAPVINNLSLTTVIIYSAMAFAAYKAFKHVTR